MRRWAESLCLQAGFSPRVIFQTSDIVTQLEFVRRSRAAAFIPGLAPDRYSSDIAKLALDGQQRTIHLVTRVGVASTPAFAALSRALRKVAAHGAIELSMDAADNLP